MALKATAWCRVLIAQFGEYFDAALHGNTPGSIDASQVALTPGRTVTMPAMW